MGKHTILLGTHGDYIHTVEFDDQAKTLVETNKLPFSKDPSWLLRHPTIKEIIYSNGHVDGKVFCLMVDDKGNLEILDEAESDGGGPTHMGVTTDGKGLVIAHYKTGNVTLIPLSPITGRFITKKPSQSQNFKLEYKPLTHPRQESSHAHQIVIHNQEIIVPDLGSNKIWRLGYENDKFIQKSSINGFKEGDGPRHCVIHPSGNYIYVLNEISNILSIHSLPPLGNPSKLINKLPIFPPQDINNLDIMTSAEIILIPPPAQSTSENSLLLCTNRDSRRKEGDAIALYTVSPDGSIVKPTTKGWYFGVGNHIRALQVDPSGKYILAAGRNGGGVVVLERDGEEDLKEVARCQIDNVVVPVWLS